MVKIKVLLVDDHKMVREGIKSVINSREDLKVIGEASNGEEAIEKTEKLKKVLNNYYNLGILVTLCYGDHNCDSAVSGKSYEDAIAIVRDNCNNISDSYGKSGQLKNSGFISDNDWKTFEKYLLE